MTGRFIFFVDRDGAFINPPFVTRLKLKNAAYDFRITSVIGKTTFIEKIIIKEYFIYQVPCTGDRKIVNRLNKFRILHH